MSSSVSLKDASARTTLAEAFKRAAQRVAVLHHPNLVEIYELGVIDGQYYAATELVDGPSLAEVLDEHQHTLRPFDLALGLEVLDALRNVLICIHNAPGPDGRRGSITHGRPRRSRWCSPTTDLLSSSMSAKRKAM